MVGASPKMFNSWSPHCVNILPHIAKRTLLIDYWFWDKKIILDNTITKILIRKKGSRKESEKEMWQQKQRAKWWKGAWAKECGQKQGTRSPRGLPWWLSSKESACNAGDLFSIPRLGGSPGKGNGYSLQYSCLENSMDREGWQAI